MLSAEQLLEVGAIVKVVAPEVTARIRVLADHHDIEWRRRSYNAGDCEGARLVFAASDDKSVNAAVVAEARARNILANAADEPELCDFYMPSIGREGPITIAVSTGGAAPGLSRHIRQQVGGSLDISEAPTQVVDRRFDLGGTGRLDAGKLGVGGRQLGGPLGDFAV